MFKIHRANDLPPRLVITQAGIPKRPEIPVKDFAETIGIQPSLVLPFEPQLYGSAANNGQMLMEVQPKSPTADGIRQLAELVTGRPIQAERKSAIPFLSFLKGKKSA
jgi:pilus assembly protein CpaE